MQRTLQTATVPSSICQALKPVRLPWPAAGVLVTGRQGLFGSSVRWPGSDLSPRRSKRTPGVLPGPRSFAKPQTKHARIAAAGPCYSGGSSLRSYQCLYRDGFHACMGTRSATSCWCCEDEQSYPGGTRRHYGEPGHRRFSFRPLSCM